MYRTSKQTLPEQGNKSLVTKRMAALLNHFLDIAVPSHETGIESYIKQLFFYKQTWCQVTFQGTTLFPFIHILWVGSPNSWEVHHYRKLVCLFSLALCAFERLIRNVTRQLSLPPDNTSALCSLLCSFSCQTQILKWLNDTNKAFKAENLLDPGIWRHFNESPISLLFSDRWPLPIDLAKPASEVLLERIA